MAITYPLSLPTSIGVAEIELRANNAVGVSQSPFTYKQQVVQHQGQNWEASISIPPVRKDLAEDWVAFLLALNGPVGRFYMGDPNMTTPRGSCSASDTISVTVDGNTGDSTLQINSGTSAVTGFLLPGDYLQVGTGTGRTLHKVLQQVDLDSSGNATVDLWPYLDREVTTTYTIVHQSPTGVFRLASNVTSWSINNSSAYGISFDAVGVRN